MQTFEDTSVLMILTAALAISACGTPAESDDDPATDAGQTTPAPVEEPEDQTSPPDSPDMPEEEDLSEEEPETQPCDPEAVAAGLVGVHAEAAVGAWEATRDGERWRLEVDASVGGPAMAAGSSSLYVDLDEAKVLELSDVEALTNEDWELALKRTEVRLNSADSGPRALMVAVSQGTFEGATPPSAQGGEWRTDDFVSDTCEVATFGRGAIQTAFGQWYDYDPATHSVSAPQDVVYFLYDTVTHSVTRLVIESYVDATYTLRWE